MMDSVSADFPERRVFVVWEPSNSRSATLAEQFGAECWYVHYLGLKRPWLAPFKYVMQAVRTWRLLAANKPELIFVQNPPVFAPLAVWLYCLFSSASFVMDTHTGAFLEKKWRWLGFLHGFLARRARVSIVTNEFLADIVHGWGGETFIFPDVPVEFPDAKRMSNRGEHFVTVVNSFSYDEPLEEVLEAARQLPEIEFAVTGDISRCPPSIEASRPDNVRFTGFVSRQEYVDMLYSSDAAVILTTENHTMQRGAYEAMSLGVPIITSDWPLLRKTFFKGAQFTDNTAKSITESLRYLIDNKQQLKQDVAELKTQRRALWSEMLTTFEASYLKDGQAAPG